MTFVKICGIRSLQHARAALDAGAEYLGFVFYAPSHRYVAPETAAEIVATCRSIYGGPKRWQAVGVFVDMAQDGVNAILDRVGLDLAQVCGAEDRDYCLGLNRPVLRAVHVAADGALPPSLDAADYGAARLLLDTSVPGHYGGTGRSHPWNRVRAIAGACFLAGGLTPTNVGHAIATAEPWAVDVSSGVERDRVKDPDLIRQFVQEVKRVGSDRVRR